MRTWIGQKMRTGIKEPRGYYVRGREKTWVQNIGTNLAGESGWRLDASFEKGMLL
jgi:hypothetical protein